jgi:hypothetical protein
MRSARTLAALFVAAATLSCTDLPLDPDGNAGGDFDVSVGAGTAPNYSWSGTTAFEVSVVRTSDQTVVVWGVASTAQNMASPVRHGTVPAGAIELTARERTLTAGTQYRVTVKLANGDQAFRDFRP